MTIKKIVFIVLVFLISKSAYAINVNYTAVDNFILGLFSIAGAIVGFLSAGVAALFSSKGKGKIFAKRVGILYGVLLIITLIVLYLIKPGSFRAWEDVRLYESGLMIGIYVLLSSAVFGIIYAYIFSRRDG